jgi:lipoprotein-anchoring transpeptidase ErfK/SrfK
MPLLAFLVPLKCAGRAATAFLMLAFLIFPAAAETASPPISGSNGLMGIWGPNSWKPQRGSSDSHGQQGTNAPGTSTESTPSSTDAQDAVPPRTSGSNGLTGEWDTNGAEERGFRGEANESSDKQGPRQGNSTESSPPGGAALELRSSPPDTELKFSPSSPSVLESSVPSADAQNAELESSPPTAQRDVDPSLSSSGSNGLIEWNANSSERQTGSSGKVLGEPDEQQGTDAPGTSTESSPPTDAQDTELEPDLSSEAQKVAPSASFHTGSIGAAGTSDSLEKDLSAYTSGRAFKVPNGQYAKISPDGPTEITPSSAPTERNLEATTPPASSVLVTIDKPTQSMTVFVDDVELYNWKVSSGVPGYATPSGTYTASSMNEIWHSKEWDDAPMPHAIFFTKEGHAIHGTEETKKLGKPASHGCVRLAPEHARTLFALVKEKGLENTEIILNGETPGGESRVAKTGSRKQQMSRAKTRVYAAPPRRFGRRGWSHRRFSGESPQRFYWRY